MSFDEWATKTRRVLENKKKKGDERYIMERRYIV
jgi:hypothetical protein